MRAVNSNQVSEGTSTLGDEAIRRIASRVDSAHAKRVQKHASTTPQKMVERKIEKTAGKPTEIRIGGLQDIPSDFEKMGTGFYRRGHHLWELAPLSDGGFVLVRKGSEDHVLGYDPEPVVREAVVTDRRGQAIKIGSKVTLPHRGKVLAGTVVVIQPGSMNVELDSGEKVDTPPDMCELMQAPIGVEVETPEMENTEEEMVEDENDISSSMGSGIESESSEALGAEFEPDLEPSSKNESEEVEVSEESESELEESESETEESESETEEPEGEPERQAMVKAASVDDPINIWRSYWHGIGQRMAKQTKEEAASKRRERREQRKRERQGLPKGVKLPPKPPSPKMAGNDDLARLKEQIRLYQQCFDELEYILQDESLKQDQEALAGEVDRVLQEYHDELEEMNGEQEEVVEDELSLETPAEEGPPTEPTTPLPKMSGKIVVSMSRL